MPISVTEDLLRAIATKEKAISDGRTIAKKGAYKNTKKSADDSLLWGQCQGSALYELSIDLAGERPVTRCTCPVRPPPCKHALGFLVYWMTQPAKFSVAEPPAELLEKREKSAERAEKRAEAAAKPRKVDEDALKKKTAGQREALDLLEKLILDVASGGLGTIDAKRAQRLADQSRQLTDAYLKGAAFALRRLAALATSRRGEDDDTYYGLREPGDDLPDDDRQRLLMRHLARLWSIVRKGQKYLDQKLDEGETQSDADAVLEELLGHDWKLVELKERGLTRQNVDLLELAFERFDDQIREERIEHSWLVDLATGDVLVERTMRPLGALDKVKGGQSYENLLQLAEAAVYPGFVNRRVRWEIAAWKPRNLTAADWERVHKAALPAIDAALAKYKEQIRNPLAPDEAVFLLRAADVQRAGDALALVDAKGAKLVLRDSPLARYRSTNNLAMAAGASLHGASLRQPASVLVRLWPGLADNAVYGQPLALVVGPTHTRLGI